METTYLTAMEVAAMLRVHVMTVRSRERNE